METIVDVPVLDQPNLLGDFTPLVDIPLDAGDEGYTRLYEVEEIIPELKIFSRSGVMPEFATDAASAMDIRADFPADPEPIKGFDYSNQSANLRVTFDKSSNSYRIVLPADHRALIPTGLFLDIPEGYEVQIWPRSGLSFKTGLMITNSIGLIDEDYVNEVFVSVVNVSGRAVVIENGERIAQIKVVKKDSVKVVSMKKPARPKTNRTGGFGSTGVK